MKIWLRMICSRTNMIHLMMHIKSLLSKTNLRTINLLMQLLILKVGLEESIHCVNQAIQIQQFLLLLYHGMINLSVLHINSVKIPRKLSISNNHSWLKIKNEVFLKKNLKRWMKQSGRLKTLIPWSYCTMKIVPETSILNISWSQWTKEFISNSIPLVTSFSQTIRCIIKHRFSALLKWCYGKKFQVMRANHCRLKISQFLWKILLQKAPT